MHDEWNQQDKDAALAVLRDHLHDLQMAQIAHGRRAIILFEGPPGAGKKAALRELAAAFDPCRFTVHEIRHDRRQASDGHWLARFWRSLPQAGDTAIFFRSWYRRVLEDRFFGRVDEKAVARAFDEINEFEAQQRDYGTLIVKLYFDVSADTQEARLHQRLSSVWGRYERDDEVLGVRDPAYGKILADLRANSNTRWSPWHMIDGNDEHAAVISALTVISDAWAEAIPAEPPRLVGGVA